MKKTLWLSLILPLLLTARSNAEIISYLLEISSGVAHTSGGLDGNGFGDVVIQGTFKLNIDSEINYVALEDVNISLTPFGFFDWSSLEGTISGTAISLSSPNPIAPSFPNQLEGTFDGSVANLEGRVADGFYDGYQYDCNISAYVVPKPGDLNADWVVDTDDIPLFLLALTDRAAYDAMYPSVDADLLGDVDMSGTFDLGDLTVFSALVSSPASASASAVPEPTTFSLAVLLLLGIAIRWRRRV